MFKKSLFFIVTLSLVFISCENDTVESKKLCENYTCALNEKCSIKDNKPICKCDEGFHKNNGICISNDTMKCQSNSCTQINRNKCSVENNKIKCSCNEGYHDDNDSCIIDTIECQSDSCTQINRNKCSIENNKIECSCNEGYHDDNGVCIIEHSTCEPDCNTWEKCNSMNQRSPLCELKEGRCNRNSDCNNMICDTNSHYCFPVKRSWNTMPSANGYGAILFNSIKNKITTYYPHIYKQVDENSPSTPNLAYDFYFGVRVNGQNTWLNTVAISNMEYIAGTGIIKVVRETSELSIIEYYWMSMLSNAPIAVAGITIKNKTTNSLNNVSIFTLGNFRVGTDNNGDGIHIKKEKADYNNTLHGFYERNWQYGYKYYQIFMMSGEGNPDVISTNEGIYNPWQEITDNNLLTEHKSSGDIGKDDVALFYQKNFTTINVNEEKSYFVAINSQYTDNGADGETIATPIKNLIFGKTFQDVLNDEKSFWNNWHSVETLPNNMTTREQRLAIQSSAFIKMGQLRENINGYGQILASLPPGGWNISWIRDMSYAVVGMIKINHMSEAVDALEFIFGNKVNIGRYNTPDWDIVGHNYQVSICRYFANGDEETDWNTAGPNIEYDGFGLALWMLDKYIQANGDNTSFINQYEENIFDKTADVLVNLVDSNGLISPDSSIWEYHWKDDGYNGKRHFAYTSITAYRGLKAAERLGNLIGRDTSVYHDTAKNLKIAIKTHLVKNNILVNFIDSDVSSFAPENGQNIYNIDASTAEAFNFGVFEPNSQIATSTLDAYNQELGNLVSQSPGYKRTNKRCEPQKHDSCIGTTGGVMANSYDVKEWIMVDFRILSFLRKRTDEYSKEKADKLYNWILTQTENNYYQIAELYNEQTGSYDGSVPMCGFGPGAYLIDLTER